MADMLIGIHAAIGEFGVFAFLWVFVELLNPSAERVKRAKIAATIGVLFFLLSWVVGGYYYLTTYGTGVKQLIKEGPMPWAHKVFMEVKEHVFLFLPFLSFLVASILCAYEREIIKDKKIKMSVLMLSGIIVLIGLAIAFMGVMVSTGMRVALEASIG